MARPRTKGVLRNSDGRYMIHAYRRGVKKPVRIYLGTRDKSNADLIYSLIATPLAFGDIDEVRGRISSFKDVANKSLEKLRSVALRYATGVSQFATQSRKRWARHEDWSDWIEGEFPEFVKEWEEAHDEELAQIDSIWASLEILDDNDRDDLINGFAAEFLDWIDADSGLLTKLHTQIGSIIGIEHKGNESLGSAKHLSACFNEWETFKLRARKNAPGDKHVRQLKYAFQEFVDLISDPPVDRLTKQHFLDWEEYLDNKTGDRGAASYRIRVFAVKTVIETTIAKTDEHEFPFPQNLERWLRLFSVERKAPGKEHKTPMSPDNFRLLLCKAEELGSIDLDSPPDSVSTSESDGTSKMRRVQRIRTMAQKKREGLMWSAILRLACNVGCDNVDVSRITLNHLRLDDRLPLFVLPRMKVAKKVGQPVERYTPLLPATVAAIRQWVQYEQPQSDDLLFRNDIGNQWEDGKLSKAFGRLRKACALPKGVWFKHLRNSGPSIAAKSRDPRIIRDDRDAFLGHTIKGQSRFYEDGVGEDLLIDMVNLIGREYFGGEKVAEPKRKQANR